MAQDKQAVEERNVKYFDSEAKHYFSLYRSRMPVGVGFRLRKRRVLELFDKPGGKILDIGCGPGVLVEDLLAQNCTYWGIDHSPKMIEQCRNNFGSRPNAHFSVAAGEQTGFPNRFFDMVICVGVLARIKDNEAILREMARVLKHGGTLLITFSNRWNPYFLWRDFVFYPVVSFLRPLYYWFTGKARRPMGASHKLYSAWSLEEKIARHQCLVTDIVYSGFNFLLPPLDSVFSHLAASSMEKLEMLRQGPFRHLGAVGVLRARKQ